MKSFLNKSRKARQGGFTLIELVTVLSVGALIIGGALGLSANTSSAQSANQMTSDITALRNATKSLFFTQGGYGTTSLNSVLISGKKVPTTMAVSGANITHSLNGAVTVTGATSSFTIAVATIPTDVCMSLLSTATGYNSIAVNAAAPITAFPISPTTASTACAAATNTLTFAAS